MTSPGVELVDGFAPAFRLGDGPVRPALLELVEQALKAAAAQGDTARIGGVAHRLKSSSRSVGALALGDLCAELENACTTGIRGSIADLLAKFEQAAAEVEHRIAVYLRVP